MIKKILMLLLCISLLTISLSSCITGYILEHRWNKEQKLRMCASYTIPIEMPFDLKRTDWWKAEIVEEDSYGRILANLHLYGTPDHPTPMEIIFICQKITFAYVYYYEDIHYLISDYTAEDILRLKETNDWGKELNESKMSRREISAAMGGYVNSKIYLDYDKVYDSIMEIFEVPEEDILAVRCLEDDNKKNILYECRLLIDGQERLYCVRITKEFGKREVAYVEFTSGEFEYETYVAFKRSCGWNYGF